MGEKTSSCIANKVDLNNIYKLLSTFRLKIVTSEYYVFRH